MSDTWGKIKNGVLKFAPLLGNAIAPGVGGIAGSMLAGVLGVENEPDAILAGLQGVSPEKVAELKQLEMTHKYDLEAMALKLAVADIEGKTKQLSNVNQTMRVEAAQGHPWSGAWRPFWGFVSAVAFGLSVLGVLVLAGYCIIYDELEMLKLIPGLVTQIAILFTVAGSILGVASWHRGQKQRIEAGEVKGKLISAIAGKIGGK